MKYQVKGAPAAAMQSFIKGFSISIAYEGIAYKCAACKLDQAAFRADKKLKSQRQGMARALHLSQPTVTRLRRILEREAIKQYTIVPDLPYLGFDLISFTFSTSKELVNPLEDKAKKWTMEEPSIMFASTGQGMDADAIMVTVHKDYADFAKFYQKFRREWGGSLENFKTFLVSVKGSTELKALSPNCLVESYVE